MIEFAPILRSGLRKRSNFRLASKLLNEYKGSSTIIDPFQVEKHWFTIDFDLNLVRPDPALEVTLLDRIEATIGILRLNGIILQEKRTNWIDAYYRGRTGLSGLRKRAPFLVRELERQELTEEIKTKHERFLRLTGKL